MKTGFFRRLSSGGVALSGGLACAGLMLAAPVALAQSSNASNDNGCFIVTSSGRRIPLDKLCGSSNPKPAVTAPVPTPTPSQVTPTEPSSEKNVFRTKIKRRLNRIPVIDVTFNGSKTFEMILDTGASGTLITQNMARALKIRPVSVTYSTIADGSTVAFPVGKVSTISVAGATVKNVPVAISAQMDVGLLGHDFFGNYDVQIKKDEVEFRQR